MTTRKSIRQLHAQATDELRAYRWSEARDTMRLKRAQVLIDQARKLDARLNGESKRRGRK